MKKIPRSICKPRKQTSHCIVSMFWPKQMYDRNISPHPRRRTSKEQIVLSTCVGYGQKKTTQGHSSWGHIIKRSITSLTMLIPQHTNFSGCLLEKQWRPFIHCCSTILPLHECCSAATSVVQVYCLSYGLNHTNTDPAENRISFVCTLQSVILSGFHLACYFASQETEQLDWQQAKPNGWLFLPSKCMSRQQCCFYVNVTNERNRQ